MIRSPFYRFVLIAFTALVARNLVADTTPGAQPAPPPVGTPVDLSKSHDFAAPTAITADGSALLPGLSALADFQAWDAADRYVYSFENWPLKQESIGGSAFVFPFHLGAGGVTDEQVSFTVDGPFPPTRILTRLDAADKASSPTHVLGGLGNMGWGGMQNYALKFSKPVSAFGFVARSTEDFKFQFSYFPGSPKNGYGISYVLTDGTVVNLGKYGDVSGTFPGQTNNFIGVVDKSGRGIVSLQFHVRGTSKGNQEITIDDLAFVTLPVAAVAPVVNLRGSHDFSDAPVTAESPTPLPDGLSALADFRFLGGSSRYVYNFDTWPKDTPDLGAATFDFSFDLKDKGVTDQSVNITASSSDTHASLTKATLINDDGSTSAVLGGLGDVGNNGWAEQTFKFQKPVWACGVSYFSPNDLGLATASYTLADGTVVNSASAATSTIAGKTRTFVGVVDPSGKGISSLTVRVHGTASAAQPVYIADLGFAMPGPPPGDWKVTLDEEFDGKVLDPKVWVTGYHFSNIINNEMQAYVPENVSVGNGVCTIKVEKRDAPNTDMTGYKGPVQHYASGAITSMGKWTQTYGYWEARVKMTGSPGTWPAFWMLTDRGKEFTNLYDRLNYPDKGHGRGAEIDIFEFMPWWKSLSGLFQAHHGIIWSYGKNSPTDPPPHSHGSYALANDGNGPGELLYPHADTEFHTYGLYWSPEELVFFIDNKPTYRVNDAAHIPNTPCYVLFNVALRQDNWGKGPMKRNPTPQEIDAGLTGPASEMQIDYFRAYSGTLDP